MTILALVRLLYKSLGRPNVYVSCYGHFLLQVPELIDRMINSSPIATEPRRNLTDFLKRPWDPVSTIAPPPKHVRLRTVEFKLQAVPE